MYTNRIDTCGRPIGELDASDHTSSSNLTSEEFRIYQQFITKIFPFVDLDPCYVQFISEKFWDLI